MKRIAAIAGLLLAAAGSFKGKAQSPQVVKKPQPVLMGTFSRKDSAQQVQPQLIPAVSPAYYTRQLGFFCRQELLLDKKTAVPVRFRLGSMEQCNQLEGKR